MTAPIADRARDAALAAFEWIAAGTVDTDDGSRAWTEFGAVDDSLYSGAPGVLLACLEARAGGVTSAAVDRSFDLARARLLHVATTGVGGLLADDGLFAGWSGVAVALRLAAVAGSDVEAATAADTLLDRVAERAMSPSADANTDLISGDAGVLVTLLTVGGTPATRTAAREVSDRLVATAEDSPEGPQWRMVPGYQILMPNFSHGTAGVAYALALAGDRLGRPDLTAVAVSGAETLVALGRHDDGWALPMSIPRQSHRPAVSFGWCHGPSGTIKLFDLLACLQPGDPRWPQIVAQCCDAVRHSGLPVRISPGFWDNVARCCGTAGVGTMVLDRYRATRDPAVLAWADTLAEDVLARAVTDGAGTRWSNHEHTADPPDLTPEPGLLQGAAGIAGWLARLAAVHDAPDTPGLDLGVPVNWV